MHGLGPDAAWTEGAGELVVLVRVTPWSGRDALDGLDALSDSRAALKVRVRAAPENGAANEAVRQVLAKALNCALSSLRRYRSQQDLCCRRGARNARLGPSHALRSRG